MSNKLAIHVKKAWVKVFNRDHRQFMKAAEKSAAEAIKAVNKSRVLGITLKELLQRESVTENCLSELLRTLQADGLELAETEIAWLMNFVRISNKLQGELNLFGEAPMDVRQMAFQCAGLLPADCAREGIQTSHELTPSVQSWKYFTDFKVRCEGMLKTLPDWDAHQRAAVRSNIDKTRKFLDELERKL